jgi:outer membrane protein TolC
MKRFNALVAAVLSALLAGQAIASPRARVAQADPPSSEDEGDGPEAKAAALFKLDDIIDVAVRLAPDIARAKTDREIAQEGAGAARKAQAWTLFANAQYQRDAVGADTPDNRLSPLQQVADDKLTASLGLTRNLPTGGNVSLELGLVHDRQELFIPQELLTGSTANQGGQQAPQSECGENPDIYCQDQASARITLKQPIARGLGSDVALADERRADLSAAEATVKAQLAAEEMIRDLVAAYWDLAYAAYEVDVRALSLAEAKKQDQITRQEMRAGTAAQTALDTVTYEIAVRDEALITAKLEFEKKSLELRQKAGLEIGRRDIVVRPNEPFEITDEDWNVDDLLAKSHKVNRQLTSVALEKKIADVDVAVAHNAMLPQIDLTLSGAVTGTGDTSGAAFSGVSGADGFGYSVIAGVQMSFELSGAARAAHNAAVAKRHRLDIDRVDLERKLDAQVVSSVKSLMSGRTRVALTDKAIAIAQENVKSERASFLAQRSSNFQVFQRLAQVSDAQLKRGRAIADYHIAVAQLQYLSGTLLDAYRIHVRPRQARGG